jgi:hypothetical protein
MTAQKDAPYPPYEFFPHGFRGANAEKLSTRLEYD